MKSIFIAVDFKLSKKIQFHKSLMRQHANINKFTLNTHKVTSLNELQPFTFQSHGIKIKTNNTVTQGKTIPVRMQGSAW